MSGTSLDGADGVLMDFSASPPQVLAAASCDFPADFRAELLALNSPGHNELHRAALAANQLAAVYAQVVNQLKTDAAQLGLDQPIQAMGAHGQTVRHRPQEFGQTDVPGVGYTLQLNNPALLAELTGIDVVADFRTADLAAGGQGAPLVPAFHAALWASPGRSVAVLNLGGISNLTLLPSHGPVLGFDCGPGNALMDYWCQQHTGRAYDAGGTWAASGQVHAGLLAQLLQAPYFSRQPPKSTGRDLFNPAWLQAQRQGFEAVGPADVQATLTALTAHACANDLRTHLPDASQLLVCGGGALNQTLMQQLQVALPHVQVQASDEHALPVMQVEAAAFAWLARAWHLRQPGNLTAVTGASGPRVLGALYPAPGR